MGWQLHGHDGGALADVGLAAALRMSSARVLPGPRQGSCRGVVVVPGEGLVGGLVGILGKDLAEDLRLLVIYLVLYALGLHKDLHATVEAPPSFGCNVVEGVGTLRLKGGSPAGVGQVAPARLLPGL